MKRMLFLIVATATLTCAVFWLWRQRILREVEQAIRQAELAFAEEEGEPAVISPAELFDPIPGEVLIVEPTSFEQRTRFGLNRFRREPLEPLLSVGSGGSAVASMEFEGPAGSYRVWVDCFARRNAQGVLRLLTDEEPVGETELRGANNQWERRLLAQTVDLAKGAELTLRVEQAKQTALVGRLALERLGPPTGAARRLRITRGPMMQWVTETSAYVVWEASVENRGSVEFGPSPALGRASAARREGRRYVVFLDGLQPATKYFYRVLGDGTVLEEGLSFRTNKPAGQPFRFVVFGDSGVGSEAQRRIAQRVEKADPDFIIHTGDLIYNAGERMNYPLGFFEPYGNLIRRIGFYPSLGNHDVGVLDGQPYLDTFWLPDNGPPELSRGRNYWFEYGDALFVALDSNAPLWRMSEVIAPWLEHTLRNSTKMWKFVYFHHPPYAAGARSESDGDSIKVRRGLVPVFERTLPDLVFVGHDHNYARKRPIGGVRYIVSGAGGAGLYEKRHDYGLNEAFYNKRHSFTVVDIDGTRLTLRQINDEDKIVDSFELQARPQSELAAIAP